MITFLGWLRPRPGRAAVAAALVLAEGAAPPLVVAALSRGLAAATARDAAAGIAAGAALAAIAVARLAVGLARQRVVRGIVLDVGGELRVAAFAAALVWRDDPGVALARVVSDVDEAQAGVAALTGLVRNALSVVALAAAAVWLAPGLAPIAAVLVLAVGLAARALGRRLRADATDAQAARAAWVARARDVLGRAVVVAAHGAIDDEVAAFAALEATDRARRLPVEAARVWPSLGVETAVTVAVGGLLALGAATDLAATVGFAVALGLLQRPLAGVADAWAGLGRAAAAAARLGPAAASPGVGAGGAGPIAVRLVGVGADVGGRPLLDGIHLDVPAGAWLGVIGPSGAGKSTLLGIIGGWVPARGVVDVGGRAPAVGDPRIGWVPQDGGLLARSAADNVRLGAPPGDAAAALAAVGFPRDPAAALGADGAPLSGGERMRVAMARALARRPGLLLLDEPTGPLDPAAAALVRAAARASGATTLLVGHDLASVDGCDRVVRLVDGRLEPA